MDNTLDDFFNISPDMLCIAGFDGYFKRVNSAFERVFGLSAEELYQRPFVERVHPDDRDRTMQKMAELYRGSDVVDFRNRHLRSDGTYRLLEWHATPAKDKSVIHAAARDITESAQQEELFQSALEASPSALVMVDSDEQISFANTEAARLFGYDQHTLSSIKLDKLVPEAEREKHSSQHRVFLHSATKRSMGQNKRLEAIRCDGTTIRVEIGLAPIQIGGKTHVLAGIHDLSAIEDAEAQILRQKQELEEKNKHLEYLATTDPLTGLRNRRSYFEQFEISLKLSRRQGRPLSVLMIDIDDFKTYNDTFGHQAGDVVLKQCSAALTRCCRESDIAGRYGGEEFSAVLPDTTAEGARVFSERFIKAVAGIQWEHGQATVSIGIATLSPEDQKTFHLDKQITALVAQADKALYRSKAKGKNRATHHDTH